MAVPPPLMAAIVILACGFVPTLGVATGDSFRNSMAARAAANRNNCNINDRGCCDGLRCPYTEGLCCIPKGSEKATSCCPLGATCSEDGQSCYQRVVHDQSTPSTPQVSAIEEATTTSNSPYAADVETMVYPELPPDWKNNHESFNPSPVDLPRISTLGKHELGSSYTPREPPHPIALEPVSQVAEASQVDHNSSGTPLKMLSGNSKSAFRQYLDSNSNIFNRVDEGDESENDPPAFLPCCKSKRQASLGECDPTCMYEKEDTPSARGPVFKRDWP